MQFSLTAVNVVIMLAYAVPGYLLIKTKAVKPDAIPAFAKVLLYICQPCLSVYSFQKVLYSPELIKNMGIFVGLNIGVMLFVLGAVFLIFFKKRQDVRNRVATVASCLGNVGFLGVPLLEALLPAHPEAVSYSAVFIVCMNILSWTICCALLTGDKKFIRIKKIFLNPPVLTLFISLPLFFTRTALPTVIFNSVSLLGKMTTPLCMIIVGMRFACASPKEIFTDWRVYFTASVKLIIMPVLAFLLTHWLPIDYAMKATMFILCCCPTATQVLNLAEINSCGQKSAANIVLSSTVFSLLSIPIMLLML